jgi:hypothetical protein
MQRSHHQMVGRVSADDTTSAKVPASKIASSFYGLIGDVLHPWVCGQAIPSFEMGAL